MRYLLVVIIFILSYLSSYSQRAPDLHLPQMAVKSNKIEFKDFRYIMKDERYVFQPSVTNWSKLSLACKFSFRFKNINFTIRIVLPPVSENIFSGIKL